MGTTVRVWQVDERRAAEVPEEMSETRRALIADGTRQLDLDQSWEELGSILECVGLDSPFDHDALSSREVKRISRTLDPLPWSKIEELCRALGSPVEDSEYVGPYYEEFRELVLNAARAGHSLAFEVL